MAFKSEIELARDDVAARVRNDVRFKMSRIAAHVINEHLAEVLGEFDAAVQRGELLNFEPKPFRVGDIAEKVRLLEAGG